MSDSLLFLLGIVPLVVMVVLILKVKCPIHYSVLITLAVTLVLAAVFWHTPIENMISGVAYGVLKGLWSIMVVILGAIFSYNLMLKTGGMDVLKNVLASVSDDKRIQILLISWCFGGFLEAAAGFGTAVAIPIGILIALGFNPLVAAIASLVANTVPTAFGAVGVPVSTLANNLGLPVTDLSATIILQLSTFTIILPFVIVAIAGGSLKAMRGVFLITLMCGISTLIPQYFAAKHLGAELPAFAGSLVSLIVVILMAKYRKGKTPEEYKIKADPNAKQHHYRVSELLRASAIYILIFLFILVCSPLFPDFKAWLGQWANTVSFTLVDGSVLAQKMEWLASPGILIIFATFVGGVIQGAKFGEMFTVLGGTVKQLKTSIVAISAIVALATMMDVSGMINSIAETLVALTGIGFIFISPVIGALGTFVTGSDTNSNVLFGKLQATAAAELNVDPIWLAAANTSGATGGKMISPQSIAIAVSAARMDGQSSAIMSGTLKYCAAYILVLGLKVGILYFLFMA